jgi:lipoprotein-anchoring transpeptidase ErfK/SrfK
LAIAPGPDAFVNSPTSTIVLDVKGLDRLDDVVVKLDGVDVTPSLARSGDQLSFTASQLADGTHFVAFRAASANLLRRDVREDWAFTVDTKVPALELERDLANGRMTTSPPQFRGSTEPFATVTVTSGALRASGVADSGGAYAVAIALPDGPSAATVVATDRAGNATETTLDVYVDAVPPALSVTQLEPTLGESQASIEIEASDQLGSPTVEVLLDGEEQRTRDKDALRILKLKKLAEGEHVLVVRAADKGGNVVTDEQTFLVDSTERFGTQALWQGARGKDVIRLQQRLRDAGYYGGTATGLYDGRTAEAVERYQKEYGFPVDGRVAGNTLTALGGRIVIDLGKLRLHLYRGDKRYRSYGVAAGQAAYPTPTGDFVVVNKQMHPTWVPPPNAAWAKGAKPIPPGPGNPLGTRWIGLSAPGVGIHGTPASYSIGSYASHGCIRMHIPDVEDLFERVVVGMPVTIRW